MSETDSVRLLYDRGEITVLKKNQSIKDALLDKFKIFLNNLQRHREAVVDTWMYQLSPFINDLVDEDELEFIIDILQEHDLSKLFEDVDESWRVTSKPRCYLDGFDKTDSDDILTFISHVHENPHHWEYYVLTDENGDYTAGDIPLCYIIEMICDWHSYSIDDKTHTAYNYWNENKDLICLSDRTYILVDNFVKYLRIPLDDLNFYKSIENDERKVFSYVKTLSNKLNDLMDNE